MKIAISVAEPSFESEVYPRFGRSQYFIIIDPETMQYESVTNPNIEAPSGAGISTAELVVKKGASAVITGSIGPKAHQALAAAGVRMLTGVNGLVRDVVADFNAGKLVDNPEASTVAESEGGAGMQRVPGMGRGMGMGGGRGMGMGGGGGAGRMAARNWNAEPQADSMRPAGEAEELSSLRQQANRLADELTRIRQRLEQLEKE